MFCALAVVVLFPLLATAQRPDYTVKGDGSKPTTASNSAVSPVNSQNGTNSADIRLPGLSPVSFLTPSGPRVISYQGLLQTSEGRPVPDGEYTVTIRLYADSLATGKVWEDTYRVQTRGGVFNVELGSGQAVLPESSQLDRDLWLSLQVGAEQELRPLSHLTASPYALNVADGAISARKISADYIRSVSINGQTLTGNGANLDIQTGDGLTAAVDPVTGAVLLKGSGIGGSGNGSGVQGNTTISGSLTVTGLAQVYSNLTLGGSFSVGGSVTLGSDGTDSISFKGRAGSNLNMAGYNITNVGILNVDSLKLNRPLSASNGGTGFGSYQTGDMLYASSSSALSRLAIGTETKVLGSNGTTPTWVDNGATITNNVSSPSALTSNTNDYSISASQTYIRLTNGSGGTLDLTGISSAGVSNGRTITIVNITSDPIRLKHHGSSSVGNQFDLPGGEDVILSHRGSATFIYDSAAGYWELKSTN